MTNIDIYEHATQRQIDNFKPTYLYLKRHKTNCLLYFGKTTRNPLTYKGSGAHWRLNYSKYGKENIETLWYELFDKIEDLIEFALLFSDLHDIVESDKFANHRIENGLDGGDPGREAVVRIKSALTGRKRSKESVEKQLQTLKEFPVEFTSERKQNISKALMGRKLSEEHKQRCREGQRSEKAINSSKKNLDRSGKIPWNKGIKTGPKKTNQKPNDSLATINDFTKLDLTISSGVNSNSVNSDIERATFKKS